MAIDIHDDKLALARELGAEFTVNAADEDPVAAIQALGGADQAIALAVSPRAFEQAYGSLRRGGTLVFVALPADNEVRLPIFETVLNGITIVGSIVGTRKDLREVFELHSAGLTRVISETRPLDHVNEAIADVEAGRVAARVVLAALKVAFGGRVTRRPGAQPPVERTRRPLHRGPAVDRGHAAAGAPVVEPHARVDDDGPVGARDHRVAVQLSDLGMGGHHRAHAHQHGLNGRDVARGEPR